jgi:hypothetical protein
VTAFEINWGTPFEWLVLSSPILYKISRILAGYLRILMATKTMPTKKPVTYTFADNIKTGSDGSTATLTHLKDARSSNGRTIYTVSGWSDKTLTCNCPGWTMLKKRNGRPQPRACKHTREEEDDSWAGMQELGAASSSQRQSRHINFRAARSSS